ncbi:ATP-grasp domain-containing protein [Streptomyces candidus]|uniref:Biotin carboxylase n=1 Tax=Streptomyces candidus TaxID=67283 RepID=A0A7X0HCQ2_9ACTN|nr:ATP-grasp domain-containing protein [Streptomyces candidus]MBB6435159.1 biotin carboxylase [Streptomyces candidus]GHH40655.1 phosphoribosylglycinamide synthetase [Streptomyces candidus]
MPDGTVLILEPESSGVDLIPAALGLGFGVHIGDRRAAHELPTAVRDAIAAGTAAHVQVDTRSVGAVADMAAALARRTQVAAVVPGFEYSISTASAVAQRLGVPGITPRSAELLRDKRRMKQALAAHGVRVAYGVPLAVERADNAVLQDVARKVGFPAVVKPVNGCGSLRVRRVEDFGELCDQVELSRRDPIDDMGLSIGGRLLVESYVTGPEVSVEGYVAEGTVRVVAVTEKQLGAEPHFVEVGHIVDAGLEPAARAEVERVTRAAVQALGLHVGVFHLEARLTSSGPVVIEVAARLGGDRIPELVAASYGFDLPRAMIQALAGLPVTPPDAGRRPRVAGVRFFSVPHPAVLGDPGRLVRRMSAVTGCRDASVSHAAGAALRPATDFRDRFGHAVLVADDRAALDAALAQVDTHVEQSVRSAAAWAS